MLKKLSDVIFMNQTQNSPCNFGKIVFYRNLIKQMRRFLAETDDHRRIVRPKEAIELREMVFTKICNENDKRLKRVEKRRDKEAAILLISSEESTPVKPTKKKAIKDETERKRKREVKSETESQNKEAPRKSSRTMRKKQETNEKPDEPIISSRKRRMDKKQAKQEKETEAV